MAEDTLTGFRRLGARVFKPALVLALVGAMSGLVGWLANRRGEVLIGDGLMTAAGVVTGIGVTAALFSWAGHRAGRRLEPASGRREREQAARTWQLTVLPLAMLMMTVAATLAASQIVRGTAERMEWFTAAVPALYALPVVLWAAASTASLRFALLSRAYDG